MTLLSSIVCSLTLLLNSNFNSSILKILLHLISIERNRFFMNYREIYDFFWLYNNLFLFLYYKLVLYIFLMEIYILTIKSQYTLLLYKTIDHQWRKIRNRDVDFCLLTFLIITAKSKIISFSIWKNNRLLFKHGKNNKVFKWS